MDKYVSAFNKEEDSWCVFDTESRTFTNLKHKELSVIENQCTEMNRINENLRGD
jgi:hypothetical protein